MASLTDQALVDTTVLYAAGNRAERRHGTALAIVRAADRGDLPVLRVPDVVLVETMNGLTRDVGHDKAVDMLDRLKASAGFDVVREPRAVWSRALGLFPDHPRLSLADACIVAAALHHRIPYLYAFDRGFDGAPGITRLNAAEDPYAR